MKNLIITGRAVFSAAILIVFTSINSATAQGSLTPPPGVPGPTMKTLDQVEARIPITVVPTNLTVSGSYYFARNLGNVRTRMYNPISQAYFYFDSLKGTNAITVLTNNVTIDLNGFTLEGIATSPLGISLGTCTNVVIRNGIVTGFYNGVGAHIGQARSANVRVSGLSVSDCPGSGIILGRWGSIAESCTVMNMGARGIQAAVVSQCVAYNCVYDAIEAEIVCNSTGQSKDSAGIVSELANNSKGVSVTYTGLRSLLVQNSYGKSTTSDGIYAENAINSSGVSSNYTGLNAFSAIGCRGQSVRWYGISAGVLSTSTGDSTYGQDVNASYKYDMP